MVVNVTHTDPGGGERKKRGANHHSTARKCNVRHGISAHDARSFDDLVAAPRLEIWGWWLIAVVGARESDGPYDSDGLDNRQEWLAGWLTMQGFAGHAC